MIYPWKERKIPAPVMRTQAKPARLLTLQAIRGVAAMLVLLFHGAILLDLRSGQQAFGGLFLGGHIGVPIFFMLSGFVIYWAHSRDIGNSSALAGYLTRRARRIYPALWVVTAMSIGWLSLQMEAPPFEAVIGAVSLVGPLDTRFLGVSWSLHFEVLFYALFALAIINRTLGIVALAAWLLACAWGLPGYAFAPINLLFVVGMALAAICQRVPAFVPIERRLAAAIPAPLIGLGGASYSIYLVHFSVMYPLSRIATAIPSDLAFLALVAAGTWAGLLFHRHVERPLLRMTAASRPRLHPAT